MTLEETYKIIKKKHKYLKEKIASEVIVNNIFHEEEEIRKCIGGPLYLKHCIDEQINSIDKDTYSLYDYDFIKPVALLNSSSRASIELFQTVSNTTFTYTFAIKNILEKNNNEYTLLLKDPFGTMVAKYNTDADIQPLTTRILSAKIRHTESGPIILELYVHNKDYFNKFEFANFTRDWFNN